MFGRYRSLALGATAILLAGGCGGSQGEPLSKGAFVKRANAICKADRRKYVAEVLGLYRRAQREGKSRQRVSRTAASSFTVPRLQAQTDEVRALNPPRSDQDQVDAILNAVEEVLEEAKEEPRRFVQRLAHFQRPFHEAHELAKAYGIQACARI